MVWIYFATILIFVVTVLAIIGRKDPDLLRERFKPGPGARDPETRPLLLLFILGHWIVAGLDVGRYHWSGTLHFGVQLIALLLFSLGLAGWGWAMYTNSFFSSEVRIQTERGHRVITGGPYRFVRHPGYAVLLVFFLASPVVLGSWWALLPVVGAAALILRRTVIEDRVLRAELPGYADYAARVRYRLLPGIW